MNKNLHVGQQASMELKGRNLMVWRSLQMVFGLIGIGIFTALVFFPDVGIQIFWNVLIPVAPAIFVLSTGFWRNICPLGTLSLLPRHLGISKSRRLSLKWQGRLQLMGVLLLFIIVPLRHILLDTDGWATAVTLALVAISALTAGYLFEWKSGWCSGLCPVHPVEKMYGQKVQFTPPNAHCGQCQNCVIPCPDSTTSMNPTKSNLRESHRISSTLLVGGLPGFIWGWFHVPDCRAGADWTDCLLAFGLPYSTLAISLSLFLVLRKYLSEKQEPLLVSAFTAAAVSCYYWYRIPALVGYGLFPMDGLLVDLTAYLPFWTVAISQIAAVGFFVWWLILRQQPPAVWAVRPPFARR